jgi:PilZ domain-containing protein
MNMPDENDAGAAYLAALKRSTVGPATGVAARASDSAAPPVPGVEKGVSLGRTGPVAEKRKSPRYRCQGSAQLREISSGAAMWATFSDISLHGCYMEAAAGYPVGSGLALTIEVNGFRVQATGEVRVSYPGLGMGISFTKVSDEDRERLRALVRSLSQPSAIVGARVAEGLSPSQQTNAVPGSANPCSANPGSANPGSANPGAALQAITKFFEDRHVLGREEFLRILRKTQG